MSARKLITFLLLITLCFSCGKEAEEEVESAILSAQIKLSKGDCDGAIGILEAQGRQNSNARYLRTLASGYACRAGYSTATLFGTDLPTIGGSGNILSAFAGFTTSTENQNEDIEDQDSFNDLQTAVDILLFAGGLRTDRNTSSAKRGAEFSTLEAGDIDAYLMYLLMAQLGKYFHFYGNTNDAGVKGSGSATTSNDCIANYDNIAADGGAITDINDQLDNGASGLCTSVADQGSIYLDSGAALDIAKMCQGVVLMNNFFDVFPSVIAAVGGSDFGGLGGLDTLIDAAYTLITTFDNDANGVVGYTSQEKCVADEANDEALQVYFVFMFETLLQ